MSRFPGMISPYSDRVENYLEKEIFEEQVYHFKTANPTPLIIDCGANTGLSCLYFSRQWPKSRIIAFEPDPLCFDLLKQNMLSQQVSNVEFINTAVCNFNGLADFYTHAVTGNAIAPVMSLRQNEATGKVIQVRVVHFGEYIRQFKCVDFCKVDIEGAESEWLQGLISTGSISQVKELVVEYHLWAKQEYDAGTFRTIIEEQGFSSTLVKSEQAVEGWPASGNEIFRFTNLKQ